MITRSAEVCVEGHSADDSMTAHKWHGRIQPSTGNRLLSQLYGNQVFSEIHVSNLYPAVKFANLVGGRFVFPKFVVGVNVIRVYVKCTTPTSTYTEGHISSKGHSASQNTTVAFSSS